jgi:hypothetical protein
MVGSARSVHLVEHYRSCRAGIRPLYHTYPDIPHIVQLTCYSTPFGSHFPRIHQTQLMTPEYATIEMMFRPKLTSLDIVCSSKYISRCRKFGIYYYEKSQTHGLPLRPLGNPRMRLKNRLERRQERQLGVKIENKVKFDSNRKRS